jgi:hypothetical protein
MAEMVEPDRTIMIVSIIGLIIIWGSFFYHKFVQGGGNGNVEEGKRVTGGSELMGEGGGEAVDVIGEEGGQKEEKPNRVGKAKGKKKKKR